MEPASAEPAPGIFGLGIGAATVGVQAYPYLFVVRIVRDDNFTIDDDKAGAHPSPCTAAFVACGMYHDYLLFLQKVVMPAGYASG